MTIKPTDLTKVAGGVNPFFVGVESQTYKVVETNTYSAVALPIYQHTAIGSAIAQVDNGSVFDVSFVFVYSGNIHDNFTVSVQNCNLPYVVITNSTVETTATGNAILCERWSASLYWLQLNLLRQLKDSITPQSLLPIVQVL